MSEIKSQDIERLHQMIRIRRFEEKAAELYSAMKIRGFLHLYVGEEAIAVGAMPALSPEDEIVSTYREHGHALARGVPMKEVMAEMYGKATGCSHGRGGSMHLIDVSRRFFGGYAIVGGGIPVAVGMALAKKLQNKTSIAVCFFGDGAMAEGSFHESINMAALWKLPVLFLCENNFYAMGTALHRYQSQTDLVVKAASYNVNATRVDGMDVEAVERAVREAAARVREGAGPQFLELQTYRFRAHSMFDSDLYRDKQEIERWKERDPIKLYMARLKERGLLDDEAVRRIEVKVDAEIEEAAQFAEQAPWEPVETLTRDVYTMEASK